MLERSVCVEHLRAGSPLTAGSITLLPIERVLLHAGRGDAYLWCAADKQPLALIVRDAGGMRVVAAGTEVVSLDALRERVPGLDRVLATL